MIYIEKSTVVQYDNEDIPFLKESYKVLLFNKVPLYSVISVRELKEEERGEVVKPKIGFNKITPDSSKVNID